MKRVSLRKRAYPVLVRSHVRGALQPGVADRIQGYFAKHPDIRAAEAAEHGFDPDSDPARYLAAELVEPEHASLRSLNPFTADDVAEWARQEDAENEHAIAKGAALYVACWLTPAQAERLAIPGGEDPAALHLTLCFLGETDALPSGAVEQASSILRAWAATTAPIAGMVSGLGRFAGSDTSEGCLYASFDAPELASERQRLCGMLADAGLAPDKTHGFTPHITLGYGPNAAASMEDLPQPLTLGSVALISPSMGNAHSDIPLVGVRKEEPAASDVHVDVPLGADAPKRKRRKKTDEELEVSLLKADDEQRVVYGVVLEPDSEDTQGDVLSKADIELAAHRYLYQRLPVGDQHGRMAPETVRPVESYIAPCDFEMGGQVVKAGSWVLAAHVPDDDLWAQVRKGEKGGWSVGGTGRRTPLSG